MSQDPKTTSCFLRHPQSCRCPSPGSTPAVSMDCASARRLVLGSWALKARGPASWLRVPSTG